MVCVMRALLQLPAYLAGLGLGHWIGSGTDFYKLAMTAGFIFGIFLAMVVREWDELKTQEEERQKEFELEWSENRRRAESNTTAD